MSPAVVGPAPTVAEVAAASKGRLLTLEEEQALGRLMRQGNLAARDLMVEHNTALVWSIALRYTSAGMTDEDIAQYGMLGLLRALQDWDPERGLKFSTYATNWIRQAITRALADQSRIIRLPVHLNDRARRVNEATAALLTELGRQPTDDEVAARAGCSLAQLQTVRVSVIRSNPASLEQALVNANRGAEDRSLIDIVADPTLDDPLAQLEAHAELSEARDLVARLLRRLPERLALIVRLRFGLDEVGEPRTLEEVGRLLHLTRERVRQLEADALRELRRLALSPAATAAD